LRKYLKFIALLLLAVLIFWWFWRRLGLSWEEVSASVAQSDWRLLALAFSVVCVTYVLRAFRWGALLAPLTPVRLRELFVATTVGFSALFLVGRAGEVVRPVVLPMRDRRVRPSASFVTIMVERICDMLAVVVVVAINLLWFNVPVERVAEFAHGRAGRFVVLMFSHGQLAGLLLLVGVALSLLGLAWFRRRSPSAINWLDKRFKRWRLMPKRLGYAITSTLEQLARALSVLTDARELVVIVFWTSLIWFAITLANWLVLRAFGMPFGLREAVFVMGWALVGSLVPTPGGAAGAFHAATAFGLIVLGVSEAEAAAASIIIHLVDFGPAVVFGLYYVLRGDINIGRLRQLTSSEAVEHAVEDEKIEPLGASAGDTEDQAEDAAPLKA
jgi:glycosyltransferase 2 family protein